MSDADLTRDEVRQELADEEVRMALSEGSGARLLREIGLWRYLGALLCAAAVAAAVILLFGLGSLFRWLQG